MYPNKAKNSVPIPQRKLPPILKEQLAKEVSKK
jgi:hypothetical protein